MNSLRSLDRSLGLRSARLMVVFMAGYIATGVAWLIDRGPTLDLTPSDPYLAILETLIVLCCPVEIVLFAAIYSASAAHKTTSLIALIFISILVTITSCVHFVLLTVGRQTDYAGIPGQHPFYPWPTVLFALDLFAWDVFQGLALLFAAWSFRGDRLKNAIRVSMLVSGAFCVLGVSGPVTGDLRLQFLSVAGYVFGLLLICILLAAYFARTFPQEE